MFFPFATTDFCGSFDDNIATLNVNLEIFRKFLLVSFTCEFINKTRFSFFISQGVALVTTACHPLLAFIRHVQKRS